LEGRPGEEGREWSRAPLHKLVLAKAIPRAIKVAQILIIRPKERKGFRASETRQLSCRFSILLPECHDDHINLDAEKSRLGITTIIIWSTSGPFSRTARAKVLLNSLISRLGRCTKAERVRLQSTPCDRRSHWWRGKKKPARCMPDTRTNHRVHE
jgi:hypothetical protein